jgi:hypothetical protein
MKRLFNLTKAILMLLTLGISQLGCTNEPILEFQEASLKTSITEKSSANRTNQSRFNASLNGGNEVPAVETHAVGQAIVTISKDETKIHYKLIVANIEASARPGPPLSRTSNDLVHAAAPTRLASPAVEA